MKTLAVLSALATIAIALPTTDHYSDTIRYTPRDITIKQREKKSTTLEGQKSPDHLEVASGQFSNKAVLSDSDARTFHGFKKPILVKKKIGYHAYRDSGEDQSQADSQEKCRKQMKMKFCEDNNSKEKVKSTPIPHPHEETGREMEHSINIAKEAVQTFEKDLQKMEHDCAENKRRNTMLGSDTDLHHDIEKARQALEHIHRKFKNIESRTTVGDDSNSKHTMGTVKSDEERMIQWKENAKNTEIAKNLEDNFKSTGSETKHKANKEFKTTVEDIDTPSNIKLEDEMTSIVEDKNRKIEIQSDSLIKDTANDQHNKDHLSRMEQHKEQTETAEKERAIENIDNKSKFEEIKENLLEKHTRNHVDNNEMVSLSELPSSASDNHARMDKELDKGHLHMQLKHESDQSMHESKHEDTTLNANSKLLRSEELEKMHEGVTADTVNHKVRNDDKKDIHQQMDLQRATQTHTMLGENKENEKTHFNSHNDNSAHLRASSDFHKELLNNMDFIEDSHHTMALQQPTGTDKAHMMKNEKLELHERLNVPGVPANTEHLKTMMHFSDNSHHINPNLKMASMFNNEEPNFNFQFNSPQDFVEQTNVQEIMPFRATGDLHDTALVKRLKTTHEKDGEPAELHDPLKVHWANSDNMRMDESSQHLNIEKLSPLRGGAMNDQHLSLNEQIRNQQRWAQAKSMNAHQLSPMNTGFGHSHGMSHDTLVSRNNGHNMMTHDKSNIDQSSFTQMSGSPKMAYEYNNPNHLAHNHAAYRSSYGPGSASYGYGGGSASSGSAVGVFPNAHVGNCAVPILLSCSPSVVSGSLAKSQYAYNAPSYRSEDMNMHKKRDVKVDEITSELKLRHATLGQQNENLETKH